MNRQQSFDDWKARAGGADILAQAVARGATLKRAGKEHTGPCPACGGTDRFSINMQKHIFNCRGATGGDVIAMVMHLDGVTFTQACEILTGEPPPNGQSNPLSDAERSARARALADARARSEADKAKQRAYEENTREAAQAIWNTSVPIQGTLAETYLNSRGIPTEQSRIERGLGVLRFHPGLPYPNKTGLYPVMVCRVDDLAGNITAIWRIFLRGDGRKADVSHPKLGLGPAGGGAVRIGGRGPRVGIAEGVESALGAWNLIARSYPVWAALSTSGMVGVEIPLGVESVTAFPDGDAPLRKRGHEYEAAIPAGRKAAEKLRARLLSEGIAVTIAAEPGPNRDYLDLWDDSLRESA